MMRPLLVSPTVVVAVVLLALSCGLPAVARGRAAQNPAGTSAQSTNVQGTSVQGTSVQGTNGPSPAEAMAAFRAARAAVDGWTVPTGEKPLLASAGDSIKRLPAVLGAAVQLRIDGRLIGRSALWSKRPGEPSAVILGEAVAAAMNEAETRLPIGPDGEGNQGDGRRIEKRALLAKEIPISLEMAGGLRDLLPAPTTLADLDAMLVPGLEGLAIRRGERVEAVFPGTLLALSEAPSSAARGLIARITGDASQALVDVATLTSTEPGKQGLTFCAFRVTHIAQGRSSLEPKFLLRGGRTVELGEVLGREKLVAFGESLAVHLVRSIDGQDGPARLRGTLRPALDAYEPVHASEASAGLVALALCEFERVRGGGGGAGGEASRARAAIDLQSSFLRRANASAPSDDEVLGAALFAAASAGRGDGGVDGRLSSMLLPTLTAEGDVASRVPTAALGLLAWVSATAPLGRPVNAGAIASAAFIKTPIAGLPSQMPFLGFAAMRIGKDAEDRASAVATLASLRELVEENQLSDATAPGDQPDLIGGISLSGVGRPLPTWSTAPMIALLAAMAADERYTKVSERPLKMASVLKGVRFLRQLSADESTLWMMPSPGAAAGGVRSAPWDQSMPPDATALALMAVCETIKAMDVMNRQRAEPVER